MIKVNGNAEMKIISPRKSDGYHHFFGYYDLNAYNHDDSKHLCHRVKFMDRLPVKNDIAELAYIDLTNGELTVFAETTAWNFQQGAMLQWYSNNEVLYNIRDGDEYRSVIHNIATNEKRYTDMAVANVSPDGKYGLAINFNRVYDFRPGYGYSEVKDKYYDVPQPDDDGVFLTDMNTGKSKLIASYKQIQSMNPSDDKYVINHITFNQTSNRFLFLNRNFPTPGKAWRTSLFTSDLDGNIHSILTDTMVSHYYWKNGTQILAYACIDDKNGIYLIDDITNHSEQLITPCFEKDIHCIYSPDRRYIIGDGYPINQYRPLYIYDTKTGESDTLINSYSIAPNIQDIRCDLHARWNRKGDRISYDTTHRGKREICEIRFI